MYHDNVEVEQHFTALDWAVKHDNVEMAKLLMAHGGDGSRDSFEWDVSYWDCGEDLDRFLQRHDLPPTTQGMKDFRERKIKNQIEKEKKQELEKQEQELAKQKYEQEKARQEQEKAKQELERIAKILESPETATKKSAGDLGGDFR